MTTTNIDKLKALANEWENCGLVNGKALAGEMMELLPAIESELDSTRAELAAAKSRGMSLQWDGDVLLYGPFAVAKVYRRDDGLGWAVYLMDSGDAVYERQMIPVDHAREDAERWAKARITTLQSQP